MSQLIAHIIVKYKILIIKDVFKCVTTPRNPKAVDEELLENFKTLVDRSFAGKTADKA